MRRLWTIARNAGFAAWFLIALLTLTMGHARSLAQSAPDGRVKVYKPGGDVTAPELLASDPLPIPAEKCKEKFQGETELSFFVDGNGRARNVMFVHPQGTDLDKLALLLLDRDRFKPGLLEGSPVTVAEAVIVNLQGCVSNPPKGTPKGYRIVRLRTQPEQRLVAPVDAPDMVRLSPEIVQVETSTGTLSTDVPIERVGNKVSAPKLLFSQEAMFSDQARQDKFGGSCVIALTVDAQGMPQNVHLAKGIGHGLDESAIAAVQRYRFKPAMRDDGPVPVMLSIVVRFQIY